MEDFECDENWSETDQIIISPMLGRITLDKYLLIYFITKAYEDFTYLYKNSL